MSDLGRIGIHVSLTVLQAQDFFRKVTDPTARVPIGIAPGWGKDFVNASSFIVPLFAGPVISDLFSVPGGPPGTQNYSLAGASRASLRKWGYSPSSVSSADDRINQCLALTGRPQLQCWTALDEYLMETIVPWVPLFLENSFEIVPSRVVNISIDQFTIVPSLDQVVVRLASSPSPS